jgi:hypothetical protein
MCERDMLVDLIVLNPVAIMAYIPLVYQLFDVLHSHTYVQRILGLFH